MCSAWHEAWKRAERGRRCGNFSNARIATWASVVGKNDKQLIVGFHGQLFIDSATRDVRRITLIADDLPRDFPTHYTSIAVDYDYVASTRTIT